MLETPVLSFGGSGSASLACLDPGRVPSAAVAPQGPPCCGDPGGGGSDPGSLGLGSSFRAARRGAGNELRVGVL